MKETNTRLTNFEELKLFVIENSVKNIKKNQKQNKDKDSCINEFIKWKK